MNYVPARVGCHWSFRGLLVIAVVLSGTGGLVQIASDTPATYHQGDGGAPAGAVPLAAPAFRSSVRDKEKFIAVASLGISMSLQVEVWEM
jgi:hypothetical protein